MHALMDEEELFYDAEEEYCDPGTGSSYSLHRAAFDNDVAKLTSLLQQTPPEQRSLLDLHGNNPLHVAALRGNAEALQALLDAGLPPSARSSRGWTPLDEACAARSMAAARLLQRAMLAEVKGEMKAKRAQLLDTMRSMPDYSLQLKWQVGSSLPGLGMLLRRYAPHDTYTVWKVGDRLRVDGSLMGIDTRNIMPEWKRGHFSLVVDGSPAGMAAAAEATVAAVAAASAAADAKARARQQRAAEWQRKQEQRDLLEQDTAEKAARSNSSSSSSSSAEPQSSSSSVGDDSSSSSGQQGAAEGGTGASSNGKHSSSSSSGGGIGGDSSGCSSEAEEQFYDPEEQQQHHCQQQLPAATSNGLISSSRVLNSSSAGCTSSSAAGTAAAATTNAGVGSPAAAAAAPVGGPRLLFLNHVKGSWVDLSADKKALKLEGRAEEEELEAELAAAMERDIGKLRVKPRNFKFAPVRGWLGGNMTEKVEGWRCSVYEATGKLLAVSTSKARLRLPKRATFDDYIGAEYGADEVTETLIDPLNPASMGPGSSNNSGNSSRQRDRDSTGKGYGEQASLSYGGAGGSSGAEGSMGLGSETDFDALMWSDPGSSKKKKKGGGSSSKPADGVGSGDGGDAGGMSGGGGRLLRARCWMAQDFPMQLAQLLPLLDVIGTANKHMAKVGKFLAKYSQMDMFPVKLQVPLLLTVYVLVSFKAFHPLTTGSQHPPPPPDFFEVPGSYKRRLLSEVMDKAAANMMGMGPGRGGSSRGGNSSGGGGGCFYGGDEGEEGMLFGDEGDEDFLAGRDEELDYELWGARQQDGGEESSSSKQAWRRKARTGLVGSGLDADMQESRW